MTEQEYEHLKEKLTEYHGKRHTVKRLLEACEGEPEYVNVDIERGGYIVETFSGEELPGLWAVLYDFFTEFRKDLQSEMQEISVIG